MDAVEEVKSRISIEDVISEYVQLKRAGRNYKGLSPFGNEKTPSFMVSPEKQIWHDFSTGKGGNIFSFVMEVEGLDFKGALELLARKANVDLTQFDRGRNAGAGKFKERLYEAVELATKFYQAHFTKSQTALDYVSKKRQFTRETAIEFRLGYSPNNGTALVDFLTKKGFTDKELQQAGLTTRRYRGVGDMFRGRLMIPLMDQQGRVVGFTARLLEDDPNAPKYINTPQTLLYDKSRHVYGLHLAKESMRKVAYTVVVEGNLDVIASHQAGVRQVVATAGTAMTEQHMKALNRFAGDVRLAFDEDKAGQNATERAIPIASKVGVNLSIVTISEGKDPDELIKKDPKLWEQAITQHQPALDWLIERYQEQLDLESSAGKRQFSDVILNVVKQLNDTVEQDHYVGKIAGVIGTSKEALVSKLSSVERESDRPRKQLKVEHKLDPKVVDMTKVQNHLLCLVLLRPKLRPHLEILTPDMLNADPARELLQFLQTHADFDGTATKQVSALRNIGDYVKMLALQHEALYQDLDEVELDYEAARLQVRLIEQFVKSKKGQLVGQMHDADEKTMHTLLEEVKKLDLLLKQAKEVKRGR
ncbi:MAG: primase [Candidatus Saccharibacteria bacterium]|nr:primase [Candidatus Saccharibacteria bacterium]